MGMKEGPWLATAKTKALASSSVGVKTAALSGGIGRVTLSSDALAALSEAQWQEIVATVATDNGWKVAHCKKSKIGSGTKTRWFTSMPTGWFDIVLARDSNSKKGHRDSVYFVELKVWPNVQTTEQKEFEKLFTACGMTCFLWYPEHWPVVQSLLTKPVEP